MKGGREKVGGKERWTGSHLRRTMQEDGMATSRGPSVPRSRVYLPVKERGWDKGLTMLSETTRSAFLQHGKRRSQIDKSS